MEEENNIQNNEDIPENSEETTEEILEELNEKIEEKVIVDEMKESYLAYSMSVIVGRALPDVRDGLKPVHRRILYAMNDMGMLHNKPFKKSARIVGEVLGKYHPHGDTAVYDSMVRMAQDFSLRYPLINGQGNFGSVDGDGAASMRYTEARLNKIAEEMLKDIDKNTVDFSPNFDESLKEPTCLPSKLPNLLINGSSGIAVGMATNIPPHNLSEVCDGVIQLIDNPEMDIMELMEFIKGPDFPTGGSILGRSGIKNQFAKGRGKVIVKSKTHIEEKGNRKRIIVDEIPYMVNKSNLLMQIVENIKEKRVEGISDLRDESDRDGMRVVIELKQNANEEVVLNQLFKHTRLQESFNSIMLCLVNNEPKVLGIKEILELFIKHRIEVITRKTQHELKVAQEKEHILKGLIIALDSIDEIIQKIKTSADAKIASEMLQNDYDLSDKQAKAILEMRLQKLSSLEQQKIRNELEKLVQLIQELESILSDRQKVMDIIKQETTEIKENYGDERKTNILEGDIEDVEDEDLIKEEKMVVTLTHQGYIKRLPVDTYKSQNRGGKGVIAAKTKDEDFVEKIFVSSTHSYLLIFTDKGKVYWKKVYKIPEASRTAKGLPIVNLIRKEQDEKVTAVIPVREFEEGKFLIFATKNGTVKRTSLDKFSNPRNGGIIALGLEEEDKLINVSLTNGNNQIMLATKDGRAVKFRETDVREMGRTAKGVRGIKIKDSELVGMVLGNDDNTLLTITNKGFGKQTKIEDYRLINRGGSGVINIKCTDKNGEVVSIKEMEGNEDLLLISKNGIAIRTASTNISTIGRNTQGVRVMKLNDEDNVVAVATVVNEDDTEELEKEIQKDDDEKTEESNDNIQEDVYTEEGREEQVVNDEIEPQEEAMVKNIEEDEDKSFDEGSEETSEEEVIEEKEEAVEEPEVQEDEIESTDSEEEKTEEPVEEKSEQEQNTEEEKPELKEEQTTVNVSDIMKKIQSGKIFKKNPFTKQI